MYCKDALNYLSFVFGLFYESSRCLLCFICIWSEHWCPTSSLAPPADIQSVRVIMAPALISWPRYTWMHGVLRTNNLPGGPDGTRWPSQRAQSTVHLSEAFLLYLSGLVFSPSSGYFCHRPSCLPSFDHLKSEVRLPPNLLRVSEFLNQLSPHSLNLAFCTFSSLSSLFFVKKDEKKQFFSNLRGAERFAGLHLGDPRPASSDKQLWMRSCFFLGLMLCIRV